MQLRKTANRQQRRRPAALALRSGGAGRLCFWVACVVCAFFWTAPAQEALSNLQAGRTAAAARDQQMQATDYTIKSGDFRMLVTPSMTAEWNDNVNASETNAMDDYILKPAVGIASSYQLTQRNLLFLDVTLGYDRYLLNPSWSSFELNSASGTGLSFDLGIKDVTLNLHDWMRYTQDSSQSPQVANTASYGTFQNTAGLAADWALNQASLSAGYDHQNVIATSAQFDSTTRASEMFFIRPGLQVHPQVTVGLEATASLTTYDKHILNDNQAYTVGSYVDLLPGEALHLTARGGFSTFQFQNTSKINTVIIIPGSVTFSKVTTSDQNSWYAGLNLSHRLNDGIAYSLDAGHEVQLGIQSDLTEDWYVRPNINWNVIKDWNFITGFFYEHGRQGVGNVTGNFNETFDWYGGELHISHPLTKSLTLAFNYRLTLRSSDQPNNGYTQNLVGLTLTYQPK